jgi:hypothetical protein
MEWFLFNHLGRNDYGETRLSFASCSIIGVACDEEQFQNTIPYRPRTGMKITQRIDIYIPQVSPNGIQPQERPFSPMDLINTGISHIPSLSRVIDAAKSWDKKTGIGHIYANCPGPSSMDHIDCHIPVLTSSLAYKRSITTKERNLCPFKTGSDLDIGDGLDHDKATLPSGSSSSRLPYLYCYNRELSSFKIQSDNLFLTANDIRLDRLQDHAAGIGSVLCKRFPKNSSFVSKALFFALIWEAGFERWTLLGIGVFGDFGQG